VRIAHLSHQAFLWIVQAVVLDDLLWYYILLTGLQDKSKMNERITMNKKKLPIGISDFKKLIEGDYYYIDKSLLIKELLDSGTAATLIPRPRRFGKTLNLSMIRYFFEKTEESNVHLFKDLAIAKYSQCMEHQGRYPVIFLTFKDVKVDTWEKCWNAIKKNISAEFKRHDYLLLGNIFKSNEKHLFQKICDGSAQLIDYSFALLNLSEYLARFYKQSPIILIDEYDAPIHAGYLNNYYKDVIEFLRNFLSGGLKDNSNLAFGMLTGILRVSKENIFSGLNNLEICSLIHDSYADKFGLIEAEVKTIVSMYQPNTNIDDVRAWYDGYNIGKVKIYNPWSIINFAKMGRTIPYWINTSDNAIVKSIISGSSARDKERIESLMNGIKITININENIVFQELSNRPETLWNFLLFTGYLTFENLRQEDLFEYADLCIPNNEVKSLYKSIILDWFSTTIGMDLYQLMLMQLTSGNTDDFKENFYNIVEQSLSTFDVGGKEPEKFYHALVLGMLASLNVTHAIKSNRESGFGRYDVMLIPHDKNKLGIIIEFKKVKKGETLKSSAQNALKQIEDKKYATELEAFGIKQIVKLAIVFKGKAVLVLEG